MENCESLDLFIAFPRIVTYIYRRIRRARESNVFADVCLLMGAHPSLWSHVLSGWDTPASVLPMGGGTPASGPRSFLEEVGATASGPRSFLGEGYPSLWSQVLSGGVPQAMPGQGYPSPPSQDMGTPSPGQHRGTPFPVARVEVPPFPARIGVCPQPGYRGTPTPDRRANACYAAGGTPLAITQEDCLVQQKFNL